MTELDELLAETFERRAATVSGSLSPETMRAALRRQRVRTAKSLVAGVVVVATAGGGLALAEPGHQGTHRSAEAVATSPTSPTSDDDGDGTVAVRLPWPGQQQLTLMLRVGTYRGAMFCFPDEPTRPLTADVVPGCVDEADLAASAPVDAGSGGRIFGIAPAGTTRVTLALSSPLGAVTAQAETAPVPSTGAAAPVVFGFPGQSSQLDAYGVLSLSTEIEAFDAHGAVLGLSRRLGSTDLWAQHEATSGHPAAGPTAAGTVATLPVESASDLLHRVWTAADGWSCVGDHATVGGLVEWGAQECVPPFRPADVTSLLAKYGSTTDVQVLRVPAAVTGCRLVEPGGRTDRATLTETGHGGLAVIRTAANRSSTATLRCVDAAGATVYDGRLDRLPRAPGNEIVSAGPIP